MEQQPNNYEGKRDDQLRSSAIGLVAALIGSIALILYAIITNL